MSIQARLKEDSRLYNSSRDVAYNFPQVLKALQDRLAEKPWPELHMALPKVTDKQTSDAVVAFTEFVVTAVNNPKENMRDALLRAGWFDCTPKAQVAVMAYVGQIMAGVFFHGARETTLGGVGPCSNIGELVESGRQVSQQMSIPRWRRPLSRLWRRLKEAARVFNPKSASRS